ncbi:HAD family hydrolase [Shinella sumterensis]|uniref:TIGR01459 family HAD-type hydrolase n=1 Tax=Shinella sumterensis TaxID=1967501 RepID=UPI00106DDC04|nr:TIGR01459 family HAD-type hydrolase [Shinella sumterensis]MCD1265245.1 TIGR01459 family HAD-type hydrolase [Shinella sumterensis]TFE98634.1 HAD family hydrolase [Shinella sumterensis]
MAQRIQSIRDIADRYDVMLCDVWGVLHNGVEAFSYASEALAEARAAGMTVVLITNSPRPHPGVKVQIRGLGVRDDAYDRIVTSGDVTRALIAKGPRKVYFIGAEKDLPLLDGLDVEPVGMDEAGIVVCAGLREDDTETVEDYREELAALAARKLPFICANPDLVVERGHRLIVCAGALAKAYEELGCTTEIAGKPHRPIYDKAIAEARDVRGDVDLSRVIAVGDGMPTDVRGAEAYGLDVLYISGGIHAQHYVEGGRTDEAKLAAFLDQERAHPKWWMPRLQ